MAKTKKKKGSRKAKPHRKAKARTKAKKRVRLPRGCGKGHWRRGGNARWRCKPGYKQHPYKHRKAKKHKKAR